MQAVAIGQVQVQQHGRIGGECDHGACLAQVHGQIDEELLALQIAQDRIGQCGIVFDQQYAHGSGK
ncbi:hypothetical protein D3C71_2202560 [compost metagenome]